jgi:hypothetical protein
MDPVTFIVAALAAGAAAGLSATAEDAIRDAYAGVKQWIQERYAGVDLANLEKNPSSASRQGTLAEELNESGAVDDPELLEQVQELRDALARNEAARQAAQVIGVRLDDVVVERDVTIEDVEASGPGVEGTGLDIGGSLTIRNIKAGQGKADAASNP